MAVLLPCVADVPLWPLVMVAVCHCQVDWSAYCQQQQGQAVLRPDLVALDLSLSFEVHCVDLLKVTCPLRLMPSGSASCCLMAGRCRFVLLGVPGSLQHKSGLHKACKHNQHMQCKDCGAMHNNVSISLMYQLLAKQQRSCLTCALSWRSLAV